MSTLAQRGQVITLLSEAMGMGARQDRACAAICLSERTVQRWQAAAGFCSIRPRTGNKSSISSCPDAGTQSVDEP